MRVGYMHGIIFCLVGDKLLSSYAGHRLTLLFVTLMSRFLLIVVRGMVLT